MENQRNTSSKILINATELNATRFLFHRVQLMLCFRLGHGLSHVFSSVNLCLLAEPMNKPFLDSSNWDTTLIQTRIAADP